MIKTVEQLQFIIKCTRLNEIILKSYNAVKSTVLGVIVIYCKEQVGENIIWKHLVKWVQERSE